MKKMTLMLLACSLLACQSKQDAMKVICNAPYECTSCVSKDEHMREKELVRHIMERLSNSEIKEMWEVLAVVPLKEQPTVLQREAQRSGLSQCPLAAEWALTRSMKHKTKPLKVSD